ncbi:MAG: hypothetical protein NTX61_00830 [Bacteroidetes bacterium]|nr:hypothetical protein [Bacteroidota bacterium]
MSLTTCDLTKKDEDTTVQHCTSTTPQHKEYSNTQTNYRYPTFSFLQNQEALIQYATYYGGLCPDKLIHVVVTVVLKMQDQIALHPIFYWGSGTYDNYSLPLNEEMNFNDNIIVYTYQGYIDISNYSFPDGSAYVHLELNFSFLNQGDLDMDKEYFYQQFKSFSCWFDYYLY